MDYEAREVDSSLVAEDTLLGAPRAMFTTRLSLDGVKTLPPKVIFTHLSAVYEAQVIAYVSFFLEELPWSVRMEMMSKILKLAAEEVSFLFEAFTVLNKSLPVRYGIHPAGISGPILLCPPTATCFYIL